MGALIVTYLLLHKKDRAAIELNVRAADVGAPEEVDTQDTETNNSTGGAAQFRGEKDKPARDIVQVTAERFGLSPREADVLRLLVAGESTAQIQDELCIAAGTFNYHMRNIYSKLGVHSRQELLVSIYNQQEQQKQ